MSRQLNVASAFAVFALSALALFAPGSTPPTELLKRQGAATSAAAPAISVQLALP